MEQFKRVQVIMLPTDIAKSDFHQLWLNENNILYNATAVKGLKSHKKSRFQEIYITSDDKIKEGDWFLNTKTKAIGQHNGSKILLFKEDKKIIATTDTSLKIEGKLWKTHTILPQPSQQFIEKYIESYNKGEVITDVLVEYQAYVITSGYSILREQEVNDKSNWLWETKVNSKDNTITIKKLKDSWNREEVIDILKRSHQGHSNKMRFGKNNSPFDIDKWIKENL